MEAPLENKPAQGPTKTQLANLKAKESKLTQVAPLSFDIVKQEGAGQYAFDVPFDELYTKKIGGDGYIAKYDSYSQASGNEEIKALRQSTGEKVYNGLMKNTAKALVYALDATVGTVYGIGAAIGNGKLSSIYDNDFANALDAQTQKLDISLPNWRTEEEKNKSLLQQMGTANFWFEDVAHGFAFVGGALLPEAIKAGLTGGASLSVTAGKYALKGALKGVGKEATESLLKRAGQKAFTSADEVFFKRQGKEVLRSLEKAGAWARGGDAVSTAGFLFRTANFEAGMEARENLRQASDNFYQDFADKNGRPPSFEEISGFMKTATSAANKLYGANLAILAVSNAAMYGKTLNVFSMGIGEKALEKSGIKAAANYIGKKAGKVGSKIIGTTEKVSEKGVVELLKANRFQKIAGNTFKILEKPATEGLFEEGLQGVAGKTMQSYLEKEYDPSIVHTESMMVDLFQSFSEQYGTQEGWKEITIGGIIGIFGGGFSRQGIAGVGKNSYSRLVKDKQKEVAVRNEQTQLVGKQVNDTLVSKAGRLRTLVKSNMTKEQRIEVEEAGSTSPEQNLKTNLSYIQAQEAFRSLDDIKGDFEAVIDNTDIDGADKQFLEDNGVSIEDYKAKLKADFSEHVKGYKVAKAAVEAVGLNKVAKGDKVVVKDAMIWNLMLGRESETVSLDAAKMLEELTGKDGLFDSMAFYGRIDTENKEKAQELSSKKELLKELRNNSVSIALQVAEAQAKKETTGTEEATQKFYEETEKMTAVNTQIGTIEEEVQRLEETLQNSFDRSTFELGKIRDEQYPMSVTEAVEQVAQLDKYIASLKKDGKTTEAAVIQELKNKFEYHADVTRELVNNHRRMLQTDFFSSKEGKGLLDSLVGPKYKMSPEFLKVIKENDELIDRALSVNELRGQEAIEVRIAKLIGENPELSEREKYKLESMLRIILTADKNAEILENILEEEAAVSEQPENEPLKEGDSIVQKTLVEKSAERKGDNLIEKTLNAMLEQVDSFRSQIAEKREEGRLQSEIDMLQEELDSLLKGAKLEDILTAEEQVLADFQQQLIELEAAENPNEDAIQELKGQIEQVEKLAGRVPVTEVINEYDKLVETNEIVFQTEEGELCAAEGLSPPTFNTGGTWEIIEEFQGASHAKGGIDIKIDSKGVSLVPHQGILKAENGMVLRSSELGTDEPSLASMSRVLNNRNSHLDWIKRGTDPEEKRAIENEDGSKSTHKLAWGEADGKYIVFPSIIEQSDGTLKELTLQEAQKLAVEKKNYLTVPSKEFAEYYSKNGLIKH